MDRRGFLFRSSLAAAGLATLGARLPAIGAAAPWPPKLAVFSKVYLETKLTFEQAAEVTAEVGLDGIDCPVRVKSGEIMPEKAEDEMPRYAEILKKHKCSMIFITTDILGIDTPNAEKVLRTAKKLGIRYYRLGFTTYPKDQSPAALIAEQRAKFKDLAALNRELGLTAIWQNHSPSNKTNLYLGGDLNTMEALMEGFSPKEIAVAFDLGHALVVHGQEWKLHFNKLKPHFGLAYVKDVNLSREGTKKFCAFGEGEFSKSDYFKELKAMGYAQPLSVHIEYEWAAKNEMTRENLVKVLKQSIQHTRQWCQV